MNEIRGLLFTNFFFPEKNRGIERKILFRMMPSTQNVLTLNRNLLLYAGNDSNLLIVFYVQIMPDDFVMQLHR
ncbi:hypothetical protein NA325_20605, partial [Salmonella sp. NW740]|uniref:hypothetical protein n=1 Tax=unclassified Salmonella TaxID=2614656 RepID=UPI003F43AC21